MTTDREQIIAAMNTCFLESNEVTFPQAERFYAIAFEAGAASRDAERDELKADAMRYRWLRDNKYTAKYPNSEFNYSMHLSFTVSGVWSDAADPAVLDAQIDAAIAKGEK